MTNITIFRLPWGQNIKNREQWYQAREHGFEFTCEHDGEEAAEHAFFITNAPLELIDSDTVEKYGLDDFRGPSLSVGDIVRVEDYVTRKMPDYFLCKTIGWEKFDGDIFEMLKYLQ
jgi:hypothetical protein